MSRAAADGYTVLSTTIVPLVVNPTLVPGTKVKLGDFDPVGMLAVVPSVLEVNAKNKQGITDFKGFIAYAKAHPGELAVAHSGTGTTNHIAELLLEQDFGIKMNPIPYKGFGARIGGSAGQPGRRHGRPVDQSPQPQIQNGALIALAVTSAKRVPQLANVPTIAELGKPDFEMVTYSALMTPKGAPQAVRQVLNDALAKAVADPEVQRQLANIGSQVVPSTIEQTAQIFAKEEAELQPLLTSGVLKPDNAR